MKIGQINRGSNLGEKIYNLAKRNDVKTIVDIGTFNGMGSTKCIYDAVKDTDKLVYSIECNKFRYEEAKKNLGNLPKNFNLIHGTIIDAKELMPTLEVLTDETINGWFAEDLEWIKDASNVLELLPEKIDLCIIDGGEFSGYIEFLKLWKRCRFIVLDDTMTNKHRGSREFILRNKDKFTILDDILIERNGFLICEVIRRENLPEKKLFIKLDKLMREKHDNNFIVDIGASSNSFFLDYNCIGVLFDMDKNKLKEIQSENLYKKIYKKITPENIVPTLQKFNTPYNFLALNLDIDSYDLFILIEVLKNYSPKIIISEINEKIPPPINFSVKYHKDWRWEKDHFYGYSINCLKPILKKFGYKIHKLIYNNVILVKGIDKTSISKYYENGYVNAGKRKNIFPYNNDVEYWQSLDTESLEKEIKKYFKKYDSKFVISNKCEILIKELL